MSTRRSPLHDVHAASGARFRTVDGWELPAEFDGTATEHAAVRERVGKFDRSHVGQLEVSGPDADQLMQRLTTNDVTALDPGEVQYTAITDADGIVLDDAVVYHLPPDQAATYLFVPNPGHDAEMEARWTRFREEWSLDANVRNRTDERAMVAIQGPDAPDALADLTEDPVRRLGRDEAITATVADVTGLVSRTGYTGEDGFELIVPLAGVATIWAELDVQPCGLDACETLRLEMGRPRSGREFDRDAEPRTPYEAGLGFAVKLDTEFVGRDALEAVYEQGVDEKLVGLRMVDRGIPGHGDAVTGPDGERLGHVTSGAKSPTLGYAIGLAYLPVEYADPDRSVRVHIDGESKKATTRTPPFVET
jgi:aminomethyltransferase